MSKDPIRYAATGHRPKDLSGYSSMGLNQLYRFALAVLAHYRPAELMVGMAQGWDQAVARAAVTLNIPFDAALPFVGQERRWPPKSQKDYHTLLGYARQVIVVSEGGFEPAKMQIRNIYMVDWAQSRGGALLALWNGKPTGGTANCLAYAHIRHVRALNVWDWWISDRWPLPATAELDGSR